MLGPVFLGIEGLVLTPAEIELLQHPCVGGVVLFARNVSGGVNQIRALTDNIHALRTPALIICVDQEGGRVARLQGRNFSALPPLAVIGEMYQNSAARARQYAYAHAVMMASEVLAVGIDLSFAPVLDLGKSVSTIIGDRAFAADPAVITDLAGHYIQGMNAAGMAAVGKHFPGHGSVTLDSHVAIPVDTRELATILDEDLIPFVHVSTQCAGMMIAHIVYPAVDAVAAGFSAVWLQRILRERLGYQGIIISDDLGMQGAALPEHDSFAARGIAALQAGCDVVLLCNELDERLNFLNAVQASPSWQARDFAVLRGR